MQSTTASRPFTIASLLNIRRVAVCWMVGGVVLMLGGCVSQQRYEGARQEANTRANELAQVQAEIQILEQQRDAAHAMSLTGLISSQRCVECSSCGSGCCSCRRR